MVNFVYKYTNPFNMASCVKYRNINIMWFVKQIIILFMLFGFVIFWVLHSNIKEIKEFRNEASEIESINDRDRMATKYRKIFSEKYGFYYQIFAWYLHSCVLNLVIFELFYSPFYIIVSYTFLFLMNILSLVIFAFIHKLIISESTNIHIRGISEFLLLMAFPIVHAIIVYIGNGVPKIICKLDSNGNLIAESIDLKRVKDGVYYYDFRKDVIWLSKEATTKGTCIELHVKNERIDKYRFWLNGNEIETIDYKDNKKLCGFDENGSPLIV